MSNMIDVDELKNLNPYIFKKRIFNSDVEYEETFEKVLKNLYALKDKKIKTLSPEDAVDILLLLTNMVVKEHYIDNEIKHTYYIRDYNGHTYTLLSKTQLSKFLVLIRNALGCKGCNASKLYEPVLTFLDGLNEKRVDLTKYNQPPSYLILFINGIVDLKTKEFFELNSQQYNDILSKYHYITKPTHSYIVFNKQNKNKRDLGKILLNSLANDDKDLLLLLQQLCFAVIEGYGRKKYFFLSGQAGAGKSTFGNLLYSLAGQQYAVTMNLNKIGDPNAINRIAFDTKLVLGDDLSKNAKLVDDALTNYKTLVSGSALSVPVKYEPNRVIQTNAVWVQMMNDDPKIYEANEAIQDRTILIKIKGKNYRRESKLDEAIAEIAKRLDEYIKPLGNCDTEFIDEFISEIIDQVEYFDKFTVTSEMEKETEQMINESNWAYNFVEDAKSRGLFNFSIIPTSHMSKFVKFHLMENNESMKLPSSQTINKELEPLMKQLGYKLSAKDKTLTSSYIPKLEYNADFIQDEIYENINSLQKSTSRYWISNEPLITDEDITNFEENYMKLDYKKINLKDKIIARYLIDSGNMDIISWYELIDVA